MLSPHPLLLSRLPLLLLTLLALMVPVLVLAPSSARAEGEADTATPISEGAVVWGVRASFRNYIGASGITISDGLTRNAAGEFVFDIADGSYDPASKKLQLDLDGAVRFHAHEGALDMTLSDFEVVIDGEQPAIFAEVVSRTLAGETVDYGRVAVVDIPFEGKSPSTSGGRTVWTDLPTTLAEDASAAFAGFYQSGSSMDPVDIDYAGPGGVPVITTEEIVSSGAPQYEAAGEIDGVGGVTNVVADAQRGVLHVQHVPSGTTVPVLQAYDYATLAPLTTTPVAAANQGYPGMVLDPGNGAVLMPQGAGLVAYRHDPTTGYASVDLAPGVGTVHDISYDAPRDRIVVLGSDGLSVLARSTSEASGYTVTPYTGVSFEARESVAMWTATIAVTSAAGSSKGARLVRLVTASQALTQEPITGVGDERSLQPGQYDQPTMVFRDGPGIWLSAYTGSKIRIGSTSSGYKATTPWLRATPGSFLVDRKEHLTHSVLMLDYSARKARVWKGDGWTDLSIPGLGSGSFSNHLGGDIGTDQTVFIGSTTEDDRLLRYRLTGVAPVATTSPASSSVSLEEGVSTEDVTLTAAFTGSDSLRWQTRVSSTGRWTTIAGATGGSLTWPATIDDNGRQFRALGASDLATATSLTATLTVKFFPRVAAQPDDVAATPGEDVQFKVMPAGSPYPSVVWQRRVDGFWQTIDDADEDVDVDGGFLTIKDADLDQSGVKIRARLANELGVTYSRTATLTVAAPSTVKREIDGGTLTWGVKQSFRDYVVGPIAHGSVTVEDGAVRNQDGTFTFAVAGGWSDPAAGTAEVQLDGSVTFAGHDGPPTCAPEYSPCLQLTVSDPVLRLDDDGAVLVADVTSKDEASHQLVEYPGVELADVDAATGWKLVGDRITAGPLPATLTSSGAGAFAGFYAAGTQLDPISLDGELGEEITEPVDVATTTTVSLASSTLTFGRQPVATVRVADAAGAPVAGTVDVEVNGRLLKGTLAGGQAKVLLPRTLRPGSHQVAVRYVGAERLLASSAATTLKVVRTRPSVTWQLGSRRITTRQTPLVRVHATIPGAAGLHPSGQVVVKDGGRVIKVATLRSTAKGRISIRLPRLARGTHHLRIELSATTLQQGVVTTYKALSVRR
ncbi:hypothetical protein ASE01_08000 [Nocardioides sp. Root190]|nr:hypothetical protein ASE01_08000 [Nocardioides sp. Root190]